MFKFILKFFELLSVCTIGSFCEWLASDPKGTIKYLSLANSVLVKSMMKTTGKSPDDGNAKNVEIEVPLKHISNFWRTLEMPPINCKTNLFVKHSSQLALWPIQQAKEFWK